MTNLLEKFGRTVPAGQVLFREGEAGREMFVIQTGRVRITKAIRGQEKLVAELTAGEFFGEMSIINDRPRTATATTVEDCVFLVLESRTFEAMIKANAEIAVRMIKKLARRLDDANAQIENLLLVDDNSRIVHWLLHLCAGAPRDTQGAVQLDVEPADVGGRTSVDEARVRDVLARLARSRLVLPGASGLVVPDVAKLQEFLEFLAMRERFGEV